MPKQVQFTKEVITKGAIEIIRTEGIEALTARSMSKKMGCSSDQTRRFVSLRNH